MTLRISFVILTLIVLAGFQLVSSPKTSSSQKTGSSRTASFNGFELVDKTGNIRKPAGFRDHYQVLGTWVVLDPKENQMHFTYASPGSAEYFRKNGKFADGTVLVKEIFATDHAPLTTGDAHWPSKTIQWFVMIKDDKNRFPNNALWGDGWGWALFKADAPDKQVATDRRKDCLPCHVPAKGDDWVYVRGYPVLHAAK